MTVDPKAMADDPSRHFETPAQVVEHDGLTPEQKVAVLRQWEVDAREMQVAEEENMGGGESGLLTDVTRALEALGAPPLHSNGGAKHGF